MLEQTKTLWHITNNGEVKKCGTQKGQCPFARGNFFRYHFEEEESAQEFVAITMSKRYGNFSTMKQHSDEKQELDLKIMDADDLATNIINLAPKVGISKDEMSALVRMTTFLHFGQRRRNRGKHETTPYIEHPLRVSTRLIRAGIKDPSIVKAAILHDTIEDTAKIFSENFGKSLTDENESRKELSEFLSKKFGAETVEIVQAVTNAHVEPEINDTPLTRRQKHTNYLNHVIEEINNNDKAALVKFSDFVDNAGSLHHTDLPKYEKMTFNQASKYKPLCEVFRSNIKNNNNVPDKTKVVWVNQLNKIEQRLDELIDKYKDNYESQLDS